MEIEKKVHLKVTLDEDDIKYLQIALKTSNILDMLVEVSRNEKKTLFGWKICDIEKAIELYDNIMGIDYGD